ncbi:type VI secretion system tip protein VgrG, partial [Cronobacter sakazakii]|nr:type VI secretion system tip protein VgrG [Cronobacter sakazakii]
KSGIEHGSQGDMLMKVAMYLVTGTGADMPNETVNFKKGDISVQDDFRSKSRND